MDNTTCNKDIVASISNMIVEDAKLKIPDPLDMQEVSFGNVSPINTLTKDNEHVPYYDMIKSETTTIPSTSIIKMEPEDVFEVEHTLLPDYPPSVSKGTLIKNESSESLDNEEIREAKFDGIMTIKQEEIHIEDEDEKANKKSIISNNIESKQDQDHNGHKCSVCDFETKWEGHLKWHMLRHKHSEKTDTFKCSLCDYKTDQQELLKKHLLQHQGFKKSDAFKCDYCEYQTEVKKEFAKHFLRHKQSNELSVFKCSICNLETVNKYYLKKHILRHNKGHIKTKKRKDIKCTTCDFKTSNKNVLETHYLRQHRNPEELEIEKFNCDHCDYETDVLRNLYAHRRRHIATLVERFSATIETFKQ